VSTEVSAEADLELQMCKPVECGELKDNMVLSNAIVSVPGIVYYPESATVQCSDGHTKSGTPGGPSSFAIQCQSDGTFSGKADGVGCVPISCGSTPDLADATKNEASRTFGGVATYTCKPGFTIGGDFQGDIFFDVECLASGAYSIPAKELQCVNVDACVRHGCGPHGTCIDNKPSEEDSEAAEDGDDVKGYPAELIGNWFTAEEPNMSCDEVCKDLGGFFDVTNSQHEGNQAGQHFWPDNEDDCEDEANTFGSIECSSTDEAAQPNCNLGANGQAPDGNWRFSSCYVSCACGGVTDSDSFLQLSSFGQKNNLSTTVEVNSPRHDLEDKYTCECAHGFEQNDVDGEKICGNSNDCGHGGCGQGTCVDLVDDYTCTCPVGYYLDTVKNNQQDEKTCVPVLCAASPPEVGNGKMVTEREDGHVFFPQKLKYECTEGFSVDGTAAMAKQSFQVDCQSSGDLTAMSRCQPVICGPSEVLPFTTLTFPATNTKPVVYTQSSKYKCDKGYTLDGDHTTDGTMEFEVACQVDATFEEVETCQPVNCGEAPRVKKATANLASDVLYGMDLQYTCNLGHTLDGKADGEKMFKRECQHDDAGFSKTDAECKCVSAGAAPKIPGAGDVITDTKGDICYNNVVAYKCLDGYTINGAKNGPTSFRATANAEGGYTPALPEKCIQYGFTVRGKVKDSRNGEAVQGANVKLGDQTVQAKFGGFYELLNVLPGKHSIKVSKGQMITSEQELLISDDVQVGGQADVSLTPVMAADQWRAEVTWKDMKDLDASASWGEVRSFHAAPFNAQYGSEVRLVQDVANGKGPETIFFSKIGNCKGENHQCDIIYKINDNERIGSMESSPVEVIVYHGEKQMGRYKVSDCAGSISEDKMWWHVFTIDAKNNNLKWNCKEGENLLQLQKPNHAAVDYNSYVGPFPGKFWRHSRRVKPAPKSALRKAVPAHSKEANQAHVAVAKSRLRQQKLAKD